MTLSSSSYQSSKLASLEILSPILILPPGLLWTLTALSNCPITSLTIERRVEDPIPWNTILPLIGSAARSLTTLVFQEAELILAMDRDFLTERDILDFISRLPHLHHLTISYTKLNTPAVRQSDPPSIEFNDLETLRAPPPLIQNLFRNPSHLPKIQSVCVLWQRGNVAQTLSVLATVLSAVLARPEPPHLSFSLSAGTYRPTFTHTPGDVAIFLNHVEALAITTVAFSFSSVDIQEIALWTALFPQVRRVDITLPAWKMSAFREDLPRLLRKVRPTQFLNKVHMNGEAFDLVRH
jgi:hypothetical protein